MHRASWRRDASGLSLVRCLKGTQCLHRVVGIGEMAPQILTITIPGEREGRERSACFPFIRGEASILLVK